MAYFKDHSFKQMTNVPEAAQALVKKTNLNEYVSQILAISVGFVLWGLVLCIHSDQIHIHAEKFSNYIGIIVVYICGIVVGAKYNGKFFTMPAVAKFHERVAQFSFNAGALAAFHELSREQCYDKTLPISLALAQGDYEGSASAMKTAGKEIINAVYSWRE